MALGGSHFIFHLPSIKSYIMFKTHEITKQLWYQVFENGPIGKKIVDNGQMGKKG